MSTQTENPERMSEQDKEERVRSYIEIMVSLNRENPIRHSEILEASIEYFRLESLFNYDPSSGIRPYVKGVQAKHESYSRLRKLLIETPQTCTLKLPPNITLEFDEFVESIVTHYFYQGKKGAL
jgi:hypothetical protein